MTHDIPDMNMNTEFQIPGLTLNELGPNLAAEIIDFDVKDIGKSIGLDVIRQLLYRHQVLCFRDQDLEAADVMAFTRLFGTPDPHLLEQFTLPGYRDILVLSNIVRDGKPIGSTQEGFGWHTDLSYMQLPAAYTVLYGLEVPPEGGDTRFASLYKAYDSLEPGERDGLRRLKGMYSYNKLYATRNYNRPLTEEQKARTPDVSHPMVRVHPHTGREGMYLNLPTCIGIEGMELEASLALVKRLFDYTTENFSYVHKWQARDLVIWDNRGVLHSATPYDKERHRRLIYRTTVQGEKPVPAPAG